MISFDEALSKASAVVLRHVNEAPSDEIAKAMMEFTIQIQTMLVPQQFVNEQSMKDFWNRYVRPSEDMTTFVLKGSSEFRFRSGYTNTEWDTFLGVLSAACCYRGKESCLDDTLKERAPELTTIRELLQDNQWACFIIVLSMTERLPRIKRLPPQ